MWLLRHSETIERTSPSRLFTQHFSTNALNSWVHSFMYKISHSLIQSITHSFVHLFLPVFIRFLVHSYFHKIHSCLLHHELFSVLLNRQMTDRKRQRDRETERQRDRKTERQIDSCDRETDRQTDRQTERQTDRETERQIDSWDTLLWKVLLQTGTPYLLYAYIAYTIVYMCTFS